MRADLHVHSTHSDGTLSPESLVALALARGVTVLAIADHDSVAGVPAALAAARGTDLTIIPAVELSTVTTDGRDAHMLGYFVDVDDDAFLAHLVDLREARLRRASAMVAALEASGMRVALEDVLEYSAGGAVGRTHVARALVDAGHAADVGDAFRRFIGHGRPFYIAKDVRTPQQAIDMISAAGGLSVLAHPGVNGNEDLIGELADGGLRGIEAYHADHTPEQRDRFAQMARERGLLVTGGTDFHSHDGPNPELGSQDIPQDAVQQLLLAGGAA